MNKKAQVIRKVGSDYENPFPTTPQFTKDELHSTFGIELSNIDFCVCQPPSFNITKIVSAMSFNLMNQNINERKNRGKENKWI